MRVRVIVRVRREVRVSVNASISITVRVLKPGLTSGLVWDCMAVEHQHVYRHRRTHAGVILNHRVPLRSNDVSVVLFARLFAS